MFLKENDTSTTVNFEHNIPALQNKNRKRAQECTTNKKGTPSIFN